MSRVLGRACRGSLGSAAVPPPSHSPGCGPRLPAGSPVWGRGSSTGQRSSEKGRPDGHLKPPDARVPDSSRWHPVSKRCPRAFSSANGPHWFCGQNSERPREPDERGRPRRPRWTKGPFQRLLGWRLLFQEPGRGRSRADGCRDRFHLPLSLSCVNVQRKHIFPEDGPRLTPGRAAASRWLRGSGARAAACGQRSDANQVAGPRFHARVPSFPPNGERVPLRS